MIAKYVTSLHEITDAYQKIQIDAKDAKVKIEPSKDSVTKLTFLEKKRRPYAFFIQDDTLTVRPVKTKWYHALRIGVDRSEIKLLVPESVFEAISVKSTVGRVDISSVTCNGTVDIQTNTGNINLEKVSCKDFHAKGNTGVVSLNKLAAQGRVAVHCNTGKVMLNDCSAPEIFAKTNTGRVCGKLPPNTVFAVRTNTGRVEVPQAPIGEVIGGRCEIKTNTGSVRFE